jgi:hypothetical protein
MFIRKRQQLNEIAIHAIVTKKSIALETVSHIGVEINVA